MVISDHMDPLQSMADGKTYDSKSAMRKGYKERGYVEVGSDYSTKQPEPKKPDRAAINASVERAMSKVGLSPV